MKQLCPQQIECRTCPRCGDEKPIDEFPFHDGGVCCGCEIEMNIQDYSVASDLPAIQGGK